MVWLGGQRSENIHGSLWSSSTFSKLKLSCFFTSHSSYTWKHQKSGVLESTAQRQWAACTLTSSGYSFHIFIFYSFFEDFVYCVLFIFALPITSTISIPDFLPDQLCVLSFFFFSFTNYQAQFELPIYSWMGGLPPMALKGEMLFNKAYIPFPAVVSCQENLRGAGLQVCLPVFILRLGLAWTCTVLTHAATTAVSSCMWLSCCVHRVFFSCAHLPTAFGSLYPLFCSDSRALVGGAVIERCPI